MAVGYPERWFRGGSGGRERLEQNLGFVTVRPNGLAPSRSTCVRLALCRFAFTIMVFSCSQFNPANPATALPWAHSTCARVLNCQMVGFTLRGSDIHPSLM
jgi:hypothetical protein